METLPQKPSVDPQELYEFHSSDDDSGFSLSDINWGSAGKLAGKLWNLATGGGEQDTGESTWDKLYKLLVQLLGQGLSSAKDMAWSMIKKLYLSTANVLLDKIYGDVITEIENEYFVDNWDEFKEAYVYNRFVIWHNKLLGKYKDKEFPLPFVEGVAAIENLLLNKAEEVVSGPTFSTETLRKLDPRTVELSNLVGTAGYFAGIASLANNNAFSVTTQAFARTLEEEAQAKREAELRFLAGREFSEKPQVPDKTEDGLSGADLKVSKDFAPVVVKQFLANNDYKEVDYVKKQGQYKEEVFSPTERENVCQGESDERLQIFSFGDTKTIFFHFCSDKLTEIREAGGPEKTYSEYIIKAKTAANPNDQWNGWTKRPGSKIYTYLKGIIDQRMANSSTTYGFWDKLGTKFADITSKLIDNSLELNTTYKYYDQKDQFILEGTKDKAPDNYAYACPAGFDTKVQELSLDKASFETRNRRAYPKCFTRVLTGDFRLVKDVITGITKGTFNLLGKTLCMIMDWLHIKSIINPILSIIGLDLCGGGDGGHPMDQIGSGASYDLTGGTMRLTPEGEGTFLTFLQFPIKVDEPGELQVHIFTEPRPEFLGGIDLKNFAKRTIKQSIAEGKLSLAKGGVVISKGNLVQVLQYIIPAPGIYMITWNGKNTLGELTENGLFYIEFRLNGKPLLSPAGKIKVGRFAINWDGHLESRKELIDLAFDGFAAPFHSTEEHLPSRSKSAKTQEFLVITDEVNDKGQPIPIVRKRVLSGSEATQKLLVKGTIVGKKIDFVFRASIKNPKKIEAPRQEISTEVSLILQEVEGINPTNDFAAITGPETEIARTGPIQITSTTKDGRKIYNSALVWSTSWVPQKRGTYFLKAILDPNNTVKEFNETNNSFWMIINVF